MDQGPGSGAMSLIALKRAGFCCRMVIGLCGHAPLERIEDEVDETDDQNDDRG